MRSLAGFAPRKQSTALQICLEHSQKKPKPLVTTTCANIPELVLHQLVLAVQGRRPSWPGHPRQQGSKSHNRAQGCSSSYSTQDMAWGPLRVRQRQKDKFLLLRRLHSTKEAISHRMAPGASRAPWGARPGPPAEKAGEGEHSLPRDELSGAGRRICRGNHPPGA